MPGEQPFGGPFGMLCGTRIFAHTVKSSVKTIRTVLRLTPEQHRVITQRAERCHLPLATWARSILVQAATKPAPDGRLLLKEPDGTLS